jgi:hypothetical protein
MLQIFDVRKCGVLQFLGEFVVHTHSSVRWYI